MVALLEVLESFHSNAPSRVTIVSNQLPSIGLIIKRIELMHRVLNIECRCMHTNTRRINGAAHWISFPARESDAETWQRPEKSKSNLQELRYLSSTRSLYLDLVPKSYKVPRRYCAIYSSACLFIVPHSEPVLIVHIQIYLSY